jgi:hypothetical protein
MRIISRRLALKQMAAVSVTTAPLVGCTRPILQFAEIPSGMRNIRQEVYNRGRAPDEFLRELIIWGRDAPEAVFARSPNYDVYSHVHYLLGPWQDDLHRRAVMLEVLRVLGGFESSWRWHLGVDTGKSEINTPCREEAGIFQCSGNSMNFSPTLRQLLAKTATSTDCITFIKTSKANKQFAIEYCARLLRFTVRHHGPLRRTLNDTANPRASSIHPYLSRRAVEEFRTLLSV